MKIIKITPELKEQIKKRVPVLCVPLSYKATEPEDQSPPFTKEPCPFCNDLMWVSKKKRELRVNQPKQYLLACGYCLVGIFKMQGYKQEDIELARIDVSGGIQ